MTGVAVRSILDLQQVTVVFFVALDSNGPSVGCERLRKAIETIVVGKVVAIGSGRHQRLDNLSWVTTPLDCVEELLVRNHLVQEFLEIGARDLRAGCRNPDDLSFRRALD